MVSSHASCAEKCFWLVFKCSPKSRFQALYSLALISSSHSLQSQFSVPLNMFTLKATLKTQWFYEDPEQTLDLETPPDIIWPNTSLNQVYQARVKFVFKGPLCLQFCWGFSICVPAQAFLTTGSVCPHCVAGCVLDSKPDIHHFCRTVFLLYYFLLGKSLTYHIKVARDN